MTTLKIKKLHKDFFTTNTFVCDSCSTLLGDDWNCCEQHHPMDVQTTDWEKVKPFIKSENGNKVTLIDGTVITQHLWGDIWD